MAAVAKAITTAYDEMYIEAVAAERKAELIETLVSFSIQIGLEDEERRVTRIRKVRAELASELAIALDDLTD